MNLLPPIVPGPLSECNRSVMVCNVIPGATVTLFVIRNGVIRPVGKKMFSTSKDVVPLEISEELIANDLVVASQELSPDESPRTSDGPQVQISIAQFNAAQVLTHLYQCSRGFFLGGMRPGTHVQILQGGLVIGTGDAIDGTAAITVPNGLPGPGSLLTARQLICPKPPLPPPSSGYLKDSPLPMTAPFPYQSGQMVPAPSILDGLTACSRSVQVTNIVPGADVILQATSGAWWASLGPSDKTTAWLPLPIQLREGEEVTIHHEVAPECELDFEHKSLIVGPQQALPKPFLAQIDCNTTTSIYAFKIKPEADIEFSVFFENVETLYRTVASTSEDILPEGVLVPAPPMPASATVKVRQGECDVWSEWSDPRTANPLTVPPLQPKISHELFSCQDVIPIENVFPLNGYLHVMSKQRGELKRESAWGNVLTISIAPSLNALDDIWIEHHVCDYIAQSERKQVHQANDVVAGEIEEPLFDGETQVTVKDVVPGARSELWEETKNQLLEQGRAPFSDTDSVNTTFSHFGQLRAGWKIFAKTLHCGYFLQTHPSVLVIFKAPILTSITPSTIIAGKPGFTLTVKGNNFRSGAKVKWNNIDRPTTFISTTELHATITAADVATVKTIPVRVINPDGQTSGSVNFTVTINTPPVVGYDELLIQNCNTSTLPGSTIHRPIHIYFRRTDLAPNDPWAPINDSPHDADYDENGFCPINSSAGARLSLDDGADYEVVCTDPLLPGCMTGDPNELACRRSQVFTIHGKAGGGVKTVIIN